MEELLNKLIGKGYKPFGITTKILHIGRTPNNYIYFDGGFGAEHCYSFRDLCSKESGLWQFVCENEMIKKEGNSEWTIIYPNERIGDYQKCHSYCKGQNEYWILEASLKDESELEDFLLNSIKLD